MENLFSGSTDALSQAKDLTNNFLNLANTYGLDGLVQNTIPQNNPAEMFGKLMESGANANPYAYTAANPIDIHNPEYNGQFIDRYKALNAFDEYGFSPTRDNEKLYNEVASGWDNFQRAGTQMFKLMGTAFLDSATWGSYSDDTAEKFKLANSIGMSSKTGPGAFALNLMVSSGYTLGILGDIAAEEILAAAIASGITYFTGGAGAAAGAAEFASTTGRNIGRLGRLATDIRDALGTQSRLYRQLHNISSSKSFGDVVKNIGTGALHIMNPFESTASAINNINKLESAGEAVSKSKKIKDGVLGLWMDTINAKNALTESMLEGNFAEDEMKWQMFNDFKNMNGRLPNETEAEELMKNVRAANYATTMANLPLIYTTNKMTFGLMSRPIENLGKNFFKLGGTEIIREFDKKTGKTVVKQLSDKFFQSQLELLKHPKLLAKNILVYSQDNFFEGFQEISQDVISGTAKDYYNAKYNNALRGSWYDYLTTNISDQMSKKGLETFMSGFLMQKMIGPVANIAGRALKGGVIAENTLGDKIQSKLENAVDRITHTKEEHAQNMAAKKKRMDDYKAETEQTINLLQEAFNANPALFFNENFEDMVSAEKLAQIMSDPNYSGHAKSEAVRQYYEQIYMTALQTGQFDNVIDTLNTMKGMSAEDLKSVWGMEKTDSFLKNIDDAIVKANEVKSRYDEATSIIERPFSQNDMRHADSATIEKMKQANNAYYSAVRSYALLRGDFEQSMKNQKEILAEMQRVFSSDFHLGRVPYQLITPLTGKGTLNQRIEEINGILNGVNGSEGLLSLDQNLLDENTKKEIENLTSEKKKLLNLYGKEQQFENGDIEITEFKDAIEDYIKFVTSTLKDVVIPASKLNDLTNLIANNYISMAQSERYSVDIAFLSDPDMFKRYVNLIHAQQKFVFEQKGNEIKNSLEKFKEKMKNDKFLQDLYDAGVFIKEEDLQKLTNSQVMPKLFDAYSNEELSYFSNKYQRAFEIIKAKYPNVHDIPIEGFRGVQSEGAANERTKLTFNEIINRYTIDGEKLTLNKEYDIEKILEIVSRTAGMASEKNLAATLMPYLKGRKIKFVNNKPMAVSHDGNVIVIDLRYFSKDYQYKTPQLEYNPSSRIEFGILKGAFGSLLSNELQNNEDFRDKIETLRKKAKEEYDKLPKEEQEKFEPYGMMDDINFCIEAMCNANFQHLLASIPASEVSEETKNKSAFREFIETVVNMFKSLVGENNNLLEESLYVITDAIKVNPLPSTEQTSVQETEQTRNELNTNDKSEAIKNYDSGVKKSLIEAFKIYKNNNRTENDIEGLSDDEIIDRDDFLYWFQNNNNAVLILKQYNDNHNKGGKEFEFKKPLYVDIFSSEQKDLWNTNHEANSLMLFMIATKLMKPGSNVLSDEMAEIYNVDKYKKVIDNIIDVHINNSIPKINGSELSPNALKEHLIKKLHYNAAQINQLTPNDLNNLAVDNITLEQRASLAVDNSKNVSEQNNMLKQIKKEFDDCRTTDELDNLYVQKIDWYDSYSEENTMFISKNDIEEAYKEAYDKLKDTPEETLAQKENALTTAGTMFEYKNSIYVVMGLDKRATKNKKIKVQDEDNKIEYFYIKDIIDNVTDISTQQQDIDVTPDNSDNAKHENATNEKTILNINDTMSPEELEKITDDNCK